MNYLAATQDEAKTRDRIRGGECYVAVVNGSVVGTIKLDWPKRHDGTPHYRLDGVASFHQFAVEPSAQGSGIGSALLDTVERRAREGGMSELALDTAETATELIGFYERRGFRFVEHVQWPLAKYRSVVMSKRLVAATRPNISGD